jgi:predicted porin
MKKSLLALAALTAFAGVASAQSSVTLFGVVDVNARNQKNDGSAGAIKSLSTDGNASSRLGFRGVEDLGGGLRAGFWIEGSLAPDTGNAAGQTWQRRSTLSLMGGFGEIRLGRDYTPTFWNQTLFDPFGTNGVGAQTNLMSQVPNGAAAATGSVLGSGATTQVRANNTIGYFLPSLGGIYGQFQVAAGENVPGNKYIGGRIGYAAGPVNVAFSAGKTEVGGTVDLKTWSVGGSFNMGFATLMAQYHKSEADGIPGGTLDQTNMLIGANVPLGSGTFKVSYGKVDTDQNFAGAGETSADQIALGYVYDLSKRTAIYAHYSRIDNDRGARFVTSGSGAALAAGVHGRNSTGYEFGVRHSF